MKTSASYRYISIWRRRIISSGFLQADPKESGGVSSNSIRVVLQGEKRKTKGSMPNYYNEELNSYPTLCVPLQLVISHLDLLDICLDDRRSSRNIVRYPHDKPLEVQVNEDRRDGLAAPEKS